MKKTYVKKSIVLLLAVSMVFSVAACGKKENTSEKQMMSEEDKDAVYTYETIEWDEEIRENIGGVQFAGDIMYATLGDYNEETEEYLSYFVTFDMQGKELSRFEINNGWDEETGTSYGVNQFKMSNNQEIYGIGYTYMNSEDEATGEWIWEEFYSLMKFDNQGNVLWENSVGSSGSQQIEDGGNYYSVNNLLCDEKGNVWVLDSVAYTCYDKDGNQGVSIAAPENVSGDAWFNKEGNIIFGQWDDNWENIDFYEIDTKAGQIKKEPLTKPGGYYQYSYYSGIGSKWDMYATNSVGVWAFNWGDTEMTKVMDYLLSDFDGTNIYNIKAISNDKFMANYYDMDWNYNAGVFTKVPKEDVVDKYIMNLACYYIDSNVRKQIVEFNRSHEDVRITLTDYSSLDNEENDWTLGTETLNSDILSGKVPDILVVPSDFDMGMYANKGLFADMYQFIEQDEDINLDDYLDNIIALGEYNGELYELIPKFNAVTLVGKKADVGDRFSWTFSDVNALMNQKGQDVNLFSRDSAMRSTVMYYGINLAFDQFYDSNTGECHFDSPEFAQFLEMLKGYPEETTEVWNDEEYWQEYETQWRNGSTILKYEHIYSFRNYVEDSQGYFGEVQGIAYEDEISGMTTCAATMIALREGRLCLTLNIRYAITADNEKDMDALTSFAGRNGLIWDMHSNSRPNYFPKENPVVGLLTDVFNKATGENRESYVMGGGTYARKLPNAIAYGLGGLQESEEDKALRAKYIQPGHGGAHEPDEALNVRLLLEAMKIYTMAVVALNDCAL